MKQDYEKLNFAVGPVMSGEEVLEVSGRNAPYFRTAEFSKIMLDCEKNLLSLASAPDNSRIIFLTGSGTAGMEATLLNTLNKNDKLLIVKGGSFGARFCEIAEALGIDGAILCRCCDMYNPKVLRGSMGSLFRLPIIKCDEIEEVLLSSRKKGLKVITTVTDKNSKKITDVSFDCGVVCVIGNEGNGVSEKTISMCDEKITIPMLGRAQSLNASMAACITMWEVMR